MHKASKAAKLLNSADLRQTEPRIAIVSVLLESGAPMTREEIAAKIGRSAPNKTTIYRTLLSLVEKGIVHKAFLEQRTWHFELAHHCGQYQCHPHFTCTSCRKTDCMTETAAPLVKLPEGYQMLRQSIRVVGICSSCRNKQRA